MARRSDADLLEALLEGRAAPEDAPRSLSRLAGVATAVREHTDVEAPTDEFRAFFRAELLEVAAAGRPTLWDRALDRVHDATAGMRHSLRTAGAAAMASTMIGTAGVAAAAQSALPGDILYSVKDLTEDARLAFASGGVERGRLHLAFARERLQEVEDGRERLSNDQLTATLDRLDREAATGAEELLSAATEGTTDPVLDELDAFTAEVRTRILDLTGDLPLSVRPAAERTLEVLRRIDVQIAGLLGDASCEACGGLPAGVPRVVLPGDGPAAPACECVAPIRSSGDDGTDADGTEPTPEEQPATQPTVPSAPSGEADSPGTSLETGTDSLGEAVDDTVEELGTTVEDLGGEVDDTASELLEPVDEVGTIVDDLLEPSPSSTDGVVGDTVDEVETTLDETVDTVEDTASELESSVDDVTGDLLD